jgi:alpha-tubulin suppressor-like RCC1 family protein
VLVDAKPFAQVTAGDAHTCAVTATKAAWCWGRNWHGQIGIGLVGGSLFLPLQVVGDVRFLGVSAGGDHACGVNGSGQAYCWGANGIGQLGSPTGGADRPSPTTVAGGLAFKAVHAGLAHTCGVTVDGRAFCWGNNLQGQLGNGNRPTLSTVPVPVAPIP